jgi:hypothetical protein
MAETLKRPREVENAKRQADRFPNGAGSCDSLDRFRAAKQLGD